MRVGAIEFTANYVSYVKEIEAVARPEFKPIIQKMLEIDPHDLITLSHILNMKPMQRDLYGRYS